MITCKEDLVNTYIVNDNGVLRDVYVSLLGLYKIKSLGDAEFEYMKEKNSIGCRSWFGEPAKGEHNSAGSKWLAAKQLTLTDLLPASYENTKVYSLDEDVIRKYAELCGVEYDHDHEFYKGIGYVLQSNGFISCFVAESIADESDKTKTLTTEQILAAWDLRFNQDGESKMIDLELAKKIGATHYTPVNGLDAMYKFNGPMAMSYCCGEWLNCLVGCHPLDELERINFNPESTEGCFWSGMEECINEKPSIETLQSALDKSQLKAMELTEQLAEAKGVKPPRTKFEYVVNRKSIFDLKDDLKRGLLFLRGEDAYHKIHTPAQLCEEWNNVQIYRRTEVEIDWKEETNNKHNNVVYDDSLVGVTPMPVKEFVEMCHLVESLTDKPE